MILDAGNSFVVISMAIIVINYMSMFFSFPRRYRLRYTIPVIILSGAAFFIIIYLTNSPRTSFGGLRGLFFFPVLAWLLVGGLFQKLFAFFLPYLLTMWLFTFVEAVLKTFMEYGTGEYFLTLMAVTLIVFAGYIFLLIKSGRHLLKRLFELGRPDEWAIYSLGAFSSFFLLMFLRSAGISNVPFILLLLFIFWSFGVLCYAIISTLTKTKKYLSGVQGQMPDKDIWYYCKNPVINALLGSYAERCAKENIEFNVQLAMPKTLSITNYDMCIILGNLLENAMEACCKQKNTAVKSGRIKLAIKTQGTLLVVMVKNNFSGEIVTDGTQGKTGLPLSRKENGGFGLRSIRAVATRYDGNLLTEWNNNTFTTYVMLKMQ